MKLEAVTVAGRRMHRMTLAGVTRTAPASETLATLREAIRQERAHHQQLQRDESAAQDAVRANVSYGRDAAEARGDLARVQHAKAAAVERIADLEALAEQVRDDAAEAYAAQLHQQHDAAMAAVTATFPPIPPLEVLK